MSWLHLRVVAYDFIGLVVAHNLRFCLLAVLLDLKNNESLLYTYGNAPDNSFEI
jgi:hypothetical protein